MKWWLCLVLAGCHSSESPEAGRFPVPMVAAGSDEDAVVASVDGRPIRASQVAVQARAHGTDARKALAELVDAEVLASEAARRGLDRDREAQESARAEAVRRLLETSFEKDVTPQAVPDGLIKKVYEKNRPQLDHEIKIDVWHILVDTRKLSAAEKETARASALELARRARGVDSLSAFKALAPPGARLEHVVTERDGWTLKEFSYPAFEQLHKPGDTSSVIETSYGYHVLYLVGLIPARHTSLAEAEPELRKGVFPEFQKPEFLRYCDRLAGGHEITVHPERLKP